MSLFNYFKPAISPLEQDSDGRKQLQSSTFNRRPTRPSIAPIQQRRRSTWQVGPLDRRRSTAFTTSEPIAEDGHVVEKPIRRLPDEIKYEVVLNYLYQRQCAAMWISHTPGQVEVSVGHSYSKDKGTFLRLQQSGDYLCCPHSLSGSPLMRSIAALNVQAAMTVRSRVITTFMSWRPTATRIPIRAGLSIQMIDDIDKLARARKLQYAAFIRTEALLVVWDDEPAHLIERIQSIESDILSMVWDDAPDKEDYAEEKTGTAPTQTDEESGKPATRLRQRYLLSAFMAASTIVLVLSLIGLAWRSIALEVTATKEWTSLAFLALAPVQFFLIFFFAGVIVTLLAQCLGPVRQLSINSRFYSALPPTRIEGSNLPYVTIQIPVYKEGLNAVLRPTIRSVQRAISTYELQGGEASIFINDDGLQLISEEDRLARINFYADNDIGWVARPPHSEANKRKGKFKKASNMNYGLEFSNRIEERLATINRRPGWTNEDEEHVYNLARDQLVQEDGKAWAAGNIRIGDYVLLCDSDTRVPEDCLLDACSEMEQSPEVAVLQFSSAVMQVSGDFFENGITFFTNMIYTAIRYAVANGDVAPFVGHNAMLRWSAVQEVAFLDEEGKERFWSESSVSEDFDMALRLQVHGYITRLAAWAGDGFKEGVSLTIYDELTRWEKYAYGCSELVFHPLKDWWRRGPFTPLICRFATSCIPLGSKLNILSYVATYYAIGSVWMFVLANYFAVGWFNGETDKYYIDSWAVWLSVITVFAIGGNVALAVIRFRSGEKAFVPALIENFAWVPMFIILFSGMSLHLSQALLSHMFSIDMQWGATSKELESTNFFMEVPKVLKKFKYSFAFNLILIIAMVVLAKAPFIPATWNITEFIAIFPLAVFTAGHLLLPIALNPGLMRFKW